MTNTNGTLALVLLVVVGCGGNAAAHTTAPRAAPQRCVLCGDAEAVTRNAVHDAMTSPTSDVVERDALRHAAMDRMESQQDSRRDIERIRRATAAFHDLDAAVDAGYPRSVPHCMSHPRAGAMGFHHLNRTLLDERIELERPEILLYSRDAAGRYVLNGVEYVVPYAAHPADAAPPAVLGQSLRRSDGLQIWYLHVWVWTANPSGIFADWNPEITCDAGTAAAPRSEASRPIPVPGAAAQPRGRSGRSARLTVRPPQARPVTARRASSRRRSGAPSTRVSFAPRGSRATLGADTRSAA